MKNLIVAVLGIVIIGVVGCASQSHPEAERNAIDSAQSHPETERNVIDSAQAWFELVDNQQYLESWEHTTEFFKSTTSRQKWQEFASTLRKVVGKVLSRELLFQENTTSIPGAPDGEYVVMSYKTSFENRGPAIETITSLLDQDNTWRVSGYHLYFPQRKPEAEREALDSVLAWLELMDHHQYMECWEETAEFFKSGVPRQSWQEVMSLLRTPLGKTLSRELIFQEYTTSVQGAPDGEYVVIHYKTSFENNTSARETIRSRLDNDNRWRVVGYYIN
jgi:hypothetical protein